MNARQDHRVDADREGDRRRAFLVLLCGLAVIFLTFHLPYLPKSLEDLDSINFALGVRDFDVARHQPHPPGYPVHVAIAKAVHVFVRDEARALGLLSVFAGTLGVVAIGMLFRRLDAAENAAGDRWTIAATALAITSPLYWFTAARPLSDMTGLVAAVAVQAATLAASTRPEVAACAFAAGLAAGVRSQVAWLTVPLLIVRGLGHASGEPGSPRTRDLRPGLMAIAFAGGVLLWFVPLVLTTGGPAAYWHALSDQGAEDLGNISMLWTTHTARAAAEALYYRLIAPWATWIVAVVVLVLAAAAVAASAARRRHALVMLAAAFGPYAVFDLLFQETFTGRYALPLVVPIAYLAVVALRALPWQAGLVGAVVLSMLDAHASGRAIAAFSRAKAPAFRLLDDMAAAARREPQPPVLAMDRRNTFDFRRPIVWADGAMPRFDRQLPAPPQHEWLEPVKYWNSGGRAPVWFVVDPKRAAIDLVQHGDPTRYRWSVTYPDLVSGARPNEMDWYRVDRPEWYVGEGWALTPEAAGVAQADRRGLAHGSIHAAVAPLGGGGLMIGGRSFDPTLRPRLRATLDGQVILDDALQPGGFLRFVEHGAPPAANGRYMVLTLTSNPPAPVAIEQFDASSRRLLLGFGEGWHEQEFNPASGMRWRWLSERGELKLGQPPDDGSISPSARGQTMLHLEGESPRKYFSRGSHLVVRSNDRVVFDRVLDDDFAVDFPLGDRPGSVVLETDQMYVPADRSRRTQDRRHLGLRIFTVKVYGRDTEANSPRAR